MVEYLLQVRRYIYINLWHCNPLQQQTIPNVMILVWIDQMERVETTSVAKANSGVKFAAENMRQQLIY